MNLFICFTPLQILIAQKSIEQYHGREFEFAIIQNSTDNKINHYINLAKKDAKKVVVLPLVKNSRFASLKALLKVFFSYRDKSYDNVFLATPKDFIPRMILNNIRFKNLYTFDDGAANIFKDSWVYKDEKLPPKQQKIRTFLEKTLSKEPKSSEFYIKNLKGHYTIFKTLENDFNKKISLVGIGANKAERQKEVKIMLGQPIYTDDLEKNVKLIESVIKKYSIDYYLPHPRDEFKISGVSYIETNLIAEDYFSQEIQKNDSVKFSFYGFFTTAFFTLVELGSVNAIYIEDDELFIHKKSIYESMKEFGIDVISIKSGDLDEN